MRRVTPGDIITPHITDSHCIELPENGWKIWKPVEARAAALGADPHRVARARHVADEARRHAARRRAARVHRPDRRGARARAASSEERHARRDSRRGSRRWCCTSGRKSRCPTSAITATGTRRSSYAVLLHPVRQPARAHPVRVDGDGQHLRHGDAGDHHLRRRRAGGHARAGASATSTRSSTGTRICRCACGSRCSSS